LKLFINILKYKITISLILVSFCINAQSSQRGNLANYYDEVLNFGFLMGVNSAKFNYDLADSLAYLDSLYTVRNPKGKGFNLGIIVDLRLQEYVTLRFTPNIAFTERGLNYTINGYKEIEYIKLVESTYLNFPLNLRLRSQRIKNFGCYLLAGGAYNLDLSAGKGDQEINPNLVAQSLRVKQHDFSYELGGGTEFYLMYFKLGIEAKISVGTKDILHRENTIFSNSLNRLNSNVFLISLTFEG
jgi:hypothetical protein